MELNLLRNLVYLPVGRTERAGRCESEKGEVIWNEVCISNWYH